MKKIAAVILVLSTACCEKKIEEARKLRPDEKETVEDRGTMQPEVAKISEPPVAKESQEKGEVEGRKSYLLLSTKEIAGDNQLLVDIINNLKDPKMGKENKRFFAELEAGKQKRLLKELLRHLNANVRIQSAQILVLLKKTDKEAIGRFIEMIKYDPDRDVRAEIARILMSLEAREAVEALIEMAEKDEYGMARANAIWALGNIGDRRAIPVIKKSLTDQDGWVRLRGVSAAKKMKLHELTQDLIDRLGDSSQMVKKRAHETLVELTDKNYGDDPKKWKKALGKNTKIR